MSKQDYYQILGVEQSASEREIKRAYKKLAMKYHPDRNQGNKNSEEKFKKIKSAYEILTDKDKRSAYDQYGHAAFEQGNTGNYSDSNTFTHSFSSTSDFSDIFGDVFGDIFGGNRKKNSKQKGSDLSYNMTITLEEAVKGTIKKINIPVLQKCPICHGYGTRSREQPQTCPTCRGHGQVQMRKGFFTVQQTCPQCRGKGNFITSPCRNCKGHGRTEQPKKLSINIPPGIDTNDKIRLNQEGEVGTYGAPSGDLYIKINVKPHSIFERNENNLHCEIPISFFMATLGGEIEVPTLDKKVKLKIPPETQSGKLLRIRGKGVKSIRNSRQGDLLCRIIVETPVNLNTQQKNLLHKLEENFNKCKDEENRPKSKRFFDGVKKFFDDLTT